MAEDQINGSNDADDVIALERVDNVIGFNRILYLEAIQSNFIKPHELSLKRDENNQFYKTISHFVKQLVESDPSSPLSLIKKAIQSKSIFANDAVICCLVICLTESTNEDLKKEIRKDFNELISTSDQLLLFMKFYSELKNGKINLGRGMRNVLLRWYESKSVDELVEIIHASKKFKKIGHKSLTHMAHVKLKDADKNKIIQSSYKAIEITSESTALEKKISKIRQLKGTINLQDVIDILKAKEFDYKLSHVPTFALKSTEVVELILPNMSFQEILDNLLNFCSHKMLKIQDPISKKICNALQVPNKVIADAKVHPIHVLLIIKELEKRLTIQHEHKNENGNASHELTEEEKAKLERKISNPYVMKRLQHIFTQTISEQPKTGCRYFVTVNLRNFRRKKVYGLHNVMCSELQAIITLALLKNEKEVTVMSFSDNFKLKAVEWSSETSYEKALEIYEREMKETPKTKEILALPLKRAIEDKKKVDVFITFVSSLGRTMGNKGKPDKLIAELQNYRRIMNSKMTKYIVINMTRKSPDLHYNASNINEKGVLEIVGFSEASTKVIEAYAKNCFA